MLTRWLSFLFPLSNFFNWQRQQVADCIAIAMQFLSALCLRKFPQSAALAKEIGFRRSTKTFALLFGVGLCLSLVVSACTSSNLTDSTASSVATSTSVPARERVVRIGYQKSGIFALIKSQAGLEKRLAALNASIKWSEFTSGPPLLEALGAESIDFGQSGDAPVVFAQAAGASLVYVANTPPSPKSVAILVPKNSSIEKVADLKGKKLALGKGSSAHYLVVQTLNAAGLKYEDIQSIYLQPPDARAAFERGSIDAWAIWDPFYAAAQRSANARVLVDGEGLTSFREFYLASRTFAYKNPDLVEQVLKEVQAVGAWAIAHPKEVAEFLAPQLGIDVETLELSESRRKRYGAEPIQAEALIEQQKIADTFSQLGLIPKPIQVAEAAWSAKQ